MYRVVLNFQGHDFHSKNFVALNNAEYVVGNFLDCVDPDFKSYYYLTIEMFEFGRWVTYSMHEYEE